MNYSEIFNRYSRNHHQKMTNSKKLIVILGSLADFDSFEYSQVLASKLNCLDKASIELILFGIGDEKSKEKFCKFNKIPFEKLIIQSTNGLHQELKLCSGVDFPIPKIFNLLLMCMGFRSHGTLIEVLRGYIGDRKASPLFQSDDQLKIGKIKLHPGRMFDLFSLSNQLRPFELATVRLINMCEILSNWSDYVHNTEYLCQRGGTFLFDNNGELIYSFKAKNLLGYSQNMSSPLDYLKSYLV